MKCVAGIQLLLSLEESIFLSLSGVNSSRTLSSRWYDAAVMLCPYDDKNTSCEFQRGKAL